jgi:hypothetical protein
LAIPTSFIVKGRRYTYVGVPRVSLQPGAKDLKAHAVGVISHCRGPERWFGLSEQVLGVS